MHPAIEAHYAENFAIGSYRVLDAQLTEQKYRTDILCLPD